MAFLLISFWWDLLLCLIVSVGLTVYVSFSQRFKYWKNKGVYFPTPLIPFGNFKDVILKKKHIGEQFMDLYQETKAHHEYFGIFMLHRPTFVVNNLDMIKTVLVKDFVHFSDHGFHYDEELEPIGGHLFNATGEKWKNLRVKLTPTFTSSKMKHMFGIVADCATKMMAYLDMGSEDDTEDVKELLAKLNTDVIGNCAFGLSYNSFQNSEGANGTKTTEFRRMGRRIFEPTFLENVIGTMDFFMPGMNLTKLKVMLLGTEIQDFFFKLVDDAVKYREENGVERNDFLQLLIRLKHSGSVDDDATGKTEPQVDDGTRLTTMQIAAQVFVFFIAGFETSSTTSSFALYELALNPDIQDTLRKEIDEVLQKYEGKVTYEALGEMAYLTTVIEETLRKYPPLPVIFRTCTKEYIIPGTDIKIEKDTPVMIPILGIQRDPEFFPNPMKFDPERFTPENKAARHHFSYLPFGEGPRICIGSRFGMMQTRLGLVSVLSKYEVSPCDKTHIPMVYDNRSFILTAQGGVWLKLTKRTK